MSAAAAAAAAAATTEEKTWFDKVERCWFGEENGVFTARFYGKGLDFAPSNVIEWTGEEAHVSQCNWSRYLRTVYDASFWFNEEIKTTRISIPIPPEVLQKIFKNTKRQS